MTLFFSSHPQELEQKEIYGASNSDDYGLCTGMLFFSLSKKSDRLHTPKFGISDRVVSGGKACKMCNNNAESSLIPLPFSRKETVKNVVIHFLLHYDV